MNRGYLTGARVVLPDQTLNDAAVLIEDGVIAAIDPLTGHGAPETPLSGYTLVPGLIDLHCDALEKEVEPRPGVHFPLPFACAQADRRNAAAGVTTVFHALSFADAELGVRNNAVATEIVRALHAWQAHALVDNRVHARYEITDPTAPPYLRSLLQGDQVHLLSFMDHTPGQGQFRDIDAYRAYLAKTYQTRGEAVDELLAAKFEAAQGAQARMQALAQLAQQRAIAIASHDDDSPAKIAVMRGLGAVIAEFPTNLDTAKAARRAGLATLFGAPNIVRGKSQSGAMRALDGVLAGVVDCLCGDYSPAALLPAVLKLPQLAGIALHQAVALVTKNPAAAAGLPDRGEIARGRRADLVAFSTAADVVLARRVWVRGQAIFSAGAARA